MDSAAHLRHIFSRLLLAEKLDVHPVHLAFFAIADEKICTESVPPHSISTSLREIEKVISNLPTFSNDGGIFPWRDFPAAGFPLFTDKQRRNYR